MDTLDRCFYFYLLHFTNVMCSVAVDCLTPGIKHRYRDVSPLWVSEDRGPVTRELHTLILPRPPSVSARPGCRH